MSYTVQEPTLRDIAFEGKGSIKILIHGLEQWRDMAELRLDIKRQNGDEGPEWIYTLETPTYSVKQVNPGGWLNLGFALKEAGRKIQQYVELEDKMELIFQEGETFRRAEAIAEMKRQQEARDADPAVGMKLAKRIVNEMRRISSEELTRHDSSGIVKVYKRGTDNHRDISVTKSWRGLILFQERYSRLSRKTVEELIADSSMEKLDISGIGMPDPRLMNFMLTKSKK